MEYNIYCDESCHLEHDGIGKMVIGCVWLPRERVSQISERLKAIKRKHGFTGELKWTKVSTGQISLYEEVLDLFWSDPEFCFRSVVVSDKSKLDHTTFNSGSHDSFYYKMFYQVLRVIITPGEQYVVYMDIKDTRSGIRMRHLREVLCSTFHDFDGSMIPKIQHIRSHESQLMQVCDIMIGAVGYQNRQMTSSKAKLGLVTRIVQAAGQQLDQTSPLSNRKFNIFIFDPSDGLR